MKSVYLFENLPPEAEQRTGGKGGMLATLFRHGYPVPPGFVVLPQAFAGETLVPEGRDAALQAASQLEAGGATRFAVRSSALGEDSASASFAGSYESLLDVRLEAIPQAIEAVRASRHNERARQYASALRLPPTPEMAVVVQQMVDARISGVLFTADPVSGSRERMAGNYTQGPGDRLVSGEVDGQPFELSRQNGRLEMPAGIPPDSSLVAHAEKLFELGGRLESALGMPQDIEWAIDQDGLHLLQARPITHLAGHNPVTGEWNDSRLGDYLWTSTNFGEALPDVMTPLTWSAMQVFFRVNRVGIESEALPMGGNIGGRLYMNISLAATFLTALGIPEEKMRHLAAETFGEIPEQIEIPRLVPSRWETLRRWLPNALRRMRLVAGLKRQVPSFICETPQKSAQLKNLIAEADSAPALRNVWQSHLEPLLEHSMLMLAAGTSDYKNLSRKLRTRLSRMVGDGETNALMSGLHPRDDLASLGPLVGLTRVREGEITRQEFAALYGHRGPSEFELSIPTAGEFPELLDGQLSEISRNPVSAAALTAAKHEQHTAAWKRLASAFPNQASRLQRDLARLSRASRTREAVRAEVVRSYRLLRPYALRAAMFTGIGEDVFFLSLEEVEALLAGDRTALAFVEQRKKSYERYRSLPPYPPIIRGRFEPEQWASDPRRRSDIFDPSLESISPDSERLRGFAGSPGIVEGPARVLESPDQGAALLPGEILVANTTNIGWTPLFPRAAAIVTDVGAPLSHAAIVARELGIPAVVGTGSATMRLRTGDRLRVNGGKGTVELL